VVSSALALPEQERHHLRHVYTQESVEVANDRSDGSQSDCFGDSVRGEILATESRHLKIELDDQCSIQTLRISPLRGLVGSLTYPKDSDEDESRKLKVMPVSVI
jgi:hypothetical protein